MKTWVQPTAGYQVRRGRNQQLCCCKGVLIDKGVEGGLNCLGRGRG